MIPNSIWKIEHFVNDFSGVIHASRLQELDWQFQKRDAETGMQVVSVIFPHREGQELLDIGMELFNTVWIGNKKLNNGLLLLISTEEKKLRIIVGKWLEFIYTNQWCQEVIEKKLRPLLNWEKYEELLAIWNQEIKKIEELKGKQNIRVLHNPFGSLITIVAFFLFPFLSIPFVLLWIFFQSLWIIFPFLISILFFWILVLFIHYFKKKIYLGVIIVFSLYTLIFLGIYGKIQSDFYFCKNNPEICEQRQREKEQRFCDTRPASCINGRIDYLSDDYKEYEQEKIKSSSQSSTYSSPSSSYSSPSFDWGGGSTNGAGAGD